VESEWISGVSCHGGRGPGGEAEERLLWREGRDARVVVSVATPFPCKSFSPPAAECRLLRADREALLAELLALRRRGCAA
jgi:hypothetical protein